MVTRETPKLHTIEEFEAFIARPENLDRHFEMIQGEFVEKPMVTQEHGRIIHILSGELYIYFKVNPIGYGEIEVRYRVPEDKHNSRQPDLSVMLDTTTPIVKKGAVLRMPDLAVEVKSPDDSYRELRDKADYYLANGTRMVWLVYPEKRLVEVLTPDDRLLLGEDEELSGGEVLPGFSLSVSVIFRLA